MDFGFARLNRSNAVIVLVVLIGFELSCIAFYPGIPNVETNFIISEGIARRYIDWHSPILAYAIGSLSRFFDLIRGYAILFLLSEGAYWLSLGLIAQHLAKTFGKRVSFILLAGALPPVYIMTLCISEDTIMGVTLLLTLAFLIDAERRNSPISLLLGMFSLLAVICERSNAIFAALPFGIWAIKLLARQLKIRPLALQRRSFIWLAGLALVCLFVGIKDFTATELIGARSINPAQMLQLWDLVGISVRTKENCVPKIYSSPPTGTTSAYLADVYSEVSSVPLFWPRVEGATIPIGFITDPPRGAILRQAWLSNICKHPLAYISHRVEAYLSAIGILHTDKLILPYADDGKFRSAAMGFLPYWTMSAWPYLSISLILALLWLNKLIVLRRFQIVLLSSGLLYGLCFFFLGTDNTQGYFYWTVLTTVSVIASTVCSPDLMRKNFKKRLPENEIGTQIVSESANAS